jgi:hypothetical protein
MTLRLEAMKGASMAEIREVKGSWACTAEVGEMPLAKGLRLTIEAAALGREQDVPCEVVGWQYRVAKQVDGTSAATLEITVQKVEEPTIPQLIAARVEGWFAGLSNDTQFFAPLMTAMMMFLVCGAAGWTLYVQPDHGLAFVGRYVRAAGGWAIVTVFFALLPWRLGIYRGAATFAKPFFSGLLTLTGFVTLGCWLIFAALPKGFSGTDAEYVAYARTLGASLSRSYWPIVVAALPWISLSAKVFGLESTGKLAEGLEKIARKKKE